MTSTMGPGTRQLRLQDLLSTRLTQQKSHYLSCQPEYRLEKEGDKKPEPIMKTDNLSEDYVIPLAHKARICSIPQVQCRKDFVEEIYDAARRDQ